jgi:hypothetical protein
MDGGGVRDTGCALLPLKAEGVMDLLPVQRADPAVSWSRGLARNLGGILRVFSSFFETSCHGRTTGKGVGALAGERSDEGADLAPVALMPDLAAALVTPLAWDPDGSGPGRFGVVALNPDVATAVPAVIAGFPNPIAMGAGWSGNDLDGTRRGRSDTDHNLGIGDARSQDDGSGDSE